MHVMTCSAATPRSALKMSSEKPFIAYNSYKRESGEDDPEPRIIH
jgi:hypothetical protein